MRDVSSETPDVTTKHNCYDLNQHTSTIEGNPLLKKHIPYYRRKSLTIEGNPFTIEGHTFLYKELLYYRKQSLTVEGNPLL